jgi:serine/threonine-protein kinase
MTTPSQSVRSSPAAASLLRQLGRALIEVELVTQNQWNQARRHVRGPDDWLTALAALKGLRAWWAPPGDSSPCLTDFQEKVIVRLVRQGRVSRLDRSLRRNSYLLLNALGRGGMGVVYQAWDLLRHRHVAIKEVLHPNAELLQRFLREADILARLDHPAIAGFLGLEKAHGVDLLVMEHIPGRTVYDHVAKLYRQGLQLSWRQAVAWAADALDALQHAHARGVVHRDVKPANLMVQEGTGRVKLIDLGLAKAATAPGSTLTMHGHPLGSHEYMPPEQWSNAARVGSAADVYGLGGVLVHMLTGMPPFPECNGLTDSWLAHSSAPRPSVRLQRPDVPAELDALIQRMMAIDPARRGTPRELKRLLGRLGGGKTAQAPEPILPALPATALPTLVGGRAMRVARAYRGGAGLGRAAVVLTRLWDRLRGCRAVY